jgi:hypothetical protein
MKILMAILLLGFCALGQTQKPILTADPSLAIPKLDFDTNGGLKIAAAAASSQNDFDFLVGKWKMFHRRLNKRFENCTAWTEFESLDENHKILNGIGDVDKYYTNELPGYEGKPFEGFTLRLFNPKTRLWSLYWVASTTGVLDPPVVGSFENNVGHFFARDTFNGKPIVMMFRWDARDKEHPIWSQAFSPDNGKTWEWNWFNVSQRIK